MTERDSTMRSADEVVDACQRGQQEGVRLSGATERELELVWFGYAELRMALREIRNIRREQIAADPAKVHEIATQALSSVAGRK